MDAKGMDFIMEEKKPKNKFVRYYKKHYEDVVDYCISVHHKFGRHNTVLFLVYGLGLSLIELEYKMLVCGLCFAISAVSFVTYMTMKFYFPKYKLQSFVF